MRSEKEIEKAYRKLKRRLKPELQPQPKYVRHWVNALEWVLKE